MHRSHIWISAVSISVLTGVHNNHASDSAKIQVTFQFGNEREHECLDIINDTGALLKWDYKIARDIKKILRNAEE